MSAAASRTRALTTRSVPAEATWVWSDGSATGAPVAEPSDHRQYADSVRLRPGRRRGGVLDGGGGAMITFPNGDTREVRVAAGSLCSSTRTELVALTAALEELLSGEVHTTSHSNRRLHRFVGGAGSAAERSGCPEDTSGGGHLAPAETARRQRAADSHAVGPCMRTATALPTARQRASGRPRAGGQRSSPSSNPGQSPDHPACRRTLHRLPAAELAGRLVPLDLAGPAPGSGGGDRDRAERSGGHPPAPVRPLKRLGA